MCSLNEHICLLGKLSPTNQQRCEKFRSKYLPVWTLTSDFAGKNRLESAGTFIAVATLW
jgi:hypothetical protein